MLPCRECGLDPFPEGLICWRCEERQNAILQRLCHATLTEEDMRYMHTMSYPPRDVQTWLNSSQAAQWNLRMAWMDVIEAARARLPRWMRR